MVNKNKQFHDEEKERMQKLMENRKEEKFMELTKKRELIREIK